MALSEQDPETLQSRLHRGRAVARMVLWTEQLLVGLWPAACLVGLFVAAAWFGLFALLGPRAHAVVLAVLSVALALLVGRGALRMRRPAADAADRFLEASSGLPHRPLSTLADRPATQDPVALAMWQAHSLRTQAAISTLKLRGPRPGLAVLDRWAVRAFMAVLLIAALAVAGRSAPARLAAALSPTFAAPGSATAPKLAAWITPPSYTGLPPVFLRADIPAVSVPAHARLLVDLTGSAAEPSIAYAGQSLTAGAIGPESWQAELELSQGGQLSVRRHGVGLGAWTIATIADQPPTASFSAPPGAIARSREIRIPWRAADDYGLASMHALLRLRARPNTPSSALDIPLVGTPKTAHGMLQRDLTAHPWAGLEVDVQLMARDAAGQEGLSPTAIITLPERSFTNPLARALIALRKQLSLHPEARADAATAVRMLAANGDTVETPPAAMVNLGAIAGILRFGRAPDAIAQAQERMWTMALALEEGALDRTTRALEAARQELRDALAEQREQQEKSDSAERTQPKTDAEKKQQDAKNDALAKKIEQLKQAIQKQLQSLIEQAKKDHSLLPFDPEAAHMTARDIDRMLKEIEQATREGRSEDAEQKMAELEKMLDQMKNTQNATPEQRRQARQNQKQRGRQQMSAAQDMAQREKALQSQADKREADPADPSRPRDQRVQNALRRALGELAQRFGDLTGEVPSALGEADQAMREANEALAAGRDHDAAVAAGRAAAALQKGNEQMGQQMAQSLGMSMGPGQQGEGDEDGSEMADGGDDGGPDQFSDTNGNGTARGTRPGERGDRKDGARDPLGRLTADGTSGADEGDDVALPDQADQASTRALQDELRRRGGEKDRPAEELRYIDRLLQAN